MNQCVPPHEENGETSATEPVQVFESVASSAPAGKTARPRPAERPRSGQPEEPDAGQVQVFECHAIPSLPGTKAKPRPPGRERDRFGPKGSDVTLAVAAS